MRRSQTAIYSGTLTWCCGSVRRWRGVEVLDSLCWHWRLCPARRSRAHIPPVPRDLSARNVQTLWGWNVREDHISHLALQSIQYTAHTTLYKLHPIHHTLHTTPHPIHHTLYNTQHCIHHTTLNTPYITAYTTPRSIHHTSLHTHHTTLHTPQPAQYTTQHCMHHATLQTSNPSHTLQHTTPHQNSRIHFTTDASQL